MLLCFFQNRHVLLNKSVKYDTIEDSNYVKGCKSDTITGVICVNEGGNMRQQVVWLI